MLHWLCSSLLAGFFALGICQAPASAQQQGLLAPGQVMGNPTFVPAPARAANFLAMLDPALCTTTGAFPVRMPTGWQCSTATGTTAILNGTFYIRTAGGPSSEIGTTLNTSDLTLTNVTSTYHNTRRSVFAVHHDFLGSQEGVTADGVQAAMARFTIRNWGTANARTASTKGANVRAIEGHALVDSSIPNDANRKTWALELGLHSQLAGDGNMANVGIYLASSHTGWQSSGVRADTGIWIGGEDGWTSGIKYVDTNNTSLLFSVDQNGLTTGKSFANVAGSFSLSAAGIQALNQNAAAAPAVMAGTILNIVGSDASTPRVSLDTFAINAAVTFRRADNTNASPQALASDDVIGSINARGYGSTGYTSGSNAQVRFAAAQAWTDTHNGTYIDVQTTANNTTTLAVVCRFENDAGVTCPNTVTGGSKGAGTINVSGGYYVAGTNIAPTPGGAALTKTDDTNVTLTLGGSPSTALVNAASITVGWTGTLSVARGGTGGGTASGTLLDNITGFSSTGLISRTGSGTYSFTAAGSGVLTALGVATNASGGIITAAPTRAGDVIYWSGTAWTTLAGNNSGTNCLQENASGVPSWASCGSGTGTPGGSNTQVQFNSSGSFGGSANLTWVSPKLTIGLAGTATGQLGMTGATSGTQTWQAAAAASGTITFPAGTVDFSATGGTSQVVKQTSSGGIFTVGRLACADLSDSANGCSNGGANPTASVGLSAVNGSAATYMRSDGAPALSQSIAPTWTGIHTWTPTQAANTSVDAVVLADTTAASSGNQQYSPRIRLTGQGWKTNATAASQAVDWIIENQPVQGAANPSSNLVFSDQINAGGYTQAFLLSSLGYHQQNNNGIGATSTDGSVLSNTTAAANNAQQWSPRLHWIGQGWKTNATAASQALDWIAELVPVQGAANPSSYLAFSYQVNAAGYTGAAYLFSSGAFGVGSTTDPGAAGVINANVGFRVANAATTGNVLRGNGTNFVSAQLACSDLSGVGNGCSNSAANPTGSVGLSAVNGSATTYMRSDAAPALDQSIAPTWTGQHIYNVARSIAAAAGAAIDDIKVQAATTTFTTTASQTITKVGKVSLYQPTLTASVASTTVTDAATLYIDNAPTHGAGGGSDVTITNAWALLIGAGASKLQATTINAALTYGGVTLSNSVTGTGSMVLSASPTFTGTLTAATSSFSGHMTIEGVTSTGATGTGKFVFDGSPTITTPTFTTSATVPLLIGGSGTTGTQLTLQTTTGNGTTDALAIVGGNNGATSFGTFNSTKLALPQSTASTSTTTGALTVAGGIGIGDSVNIGNYLVNGYTGGQISGLGGSTTPAQFHGVGVNPAMFIRWSNDTNSSGLILVKSRGTTVASYTTVAASDVIGSIQARAADGTNANSIVANFRMVAEGTISTGVVPGRMEFQTSNSVGTPTERLRIDSSGNVIVNTAALATNATDGFLYIPTSAGAPTGTPTSYTGRVPIEYDTTNHKLCVYDASWRCVQF